jgi:hypothetical protein
MVSKSTCRYEKEETLIVGIQNLFKGMLWINEKVAKGKILS